MIFLIWSLAISAAIYMFLRHKYSFFRSHDVHHLPPAPLLGNFGRTTLRLEHMTDMMQKLYNAFPDDKFVGQYEFLNNVIVLRDLELIKQVAVKDFDHFLDHRVKIDEDVDPLFGRNIFSLKGQKWRDMRSTLSPAFTGSKMRHMLPFMLECGNDMGEALKLNMKNSGKEYLDLETKDLCTRYANDVVASCAFGLKVNSFLDKNNEFYGMGKIISNFTFTQNMKFFAFMSIPTLMAKLKVTLFRKEDSDYFRRLVTDTMKNREQQHIIRNDMIHLLMEAKKGTLSHEPKSKEEHAGFATVEESDVGKEVSKRTWTEDDLIAQAVLFFIAGFDTVATAMTFLLYELAVNQDIQERLYKEIEEVNQKHKDITYNDIPHMQYLDMVVSESLRKWPVGVAGDRICCKPYNLGKAHPKAERDFIIQKGEGLWIPIWAIHHDPEYYPDPYKFDPERFSEENKDLIKPYSYLPFGVGPRNCIGSRFALLEIKIIVHQILSKFKLDPCPKTMVPVKLETKTFNLRMEGGHWLRFTPRT